MELKRTVRLSKYIAIMGWTIVRNGDRSRILEEIQKNFKTFWFLQSEFLMNYLSRQFGLLYPSYYRYRTFKYIAIMGWTIVTILSEMETAAGFLKK